MLTIKKGTVEDISFLIEAILEAERSGTQLVSYTKIFCISEERLTDMLNEILLEEIDGFEFCPSNFLVAFEEELPVATVSAWVESVSGPSSGIIKSNMFFYFLSKASLPQIEENIRTIEPINIQRAPGALQLESIYTIPLYRGRGISALLIDNHIQRHKQDNPELRKVQIQLMGENIRAVSAYLKAGFRVSERKSSEDPRIVEFLPGLERILMEKEI
ncbi:MAG: GNAT family N-acetyltransferase [Bacteroidetes bacterium]|nr:GNAT family N-acetyltransferase [Bacteroidota bacterium]